MFEQILSILLAIFGLGFLIFIHELGHLCVARFEGMTVEAFSIGFGKPFHSWVWKGIRWQVGCLPFGGYVKIAGMQRERGQEPYDIAGGFYSKNPWQRIRVALAGPLANVAFAVVAFTILWSCGGRTKFFSEYTQRIGWVDPKSSLYKEGVRPGDEIRLYNGHPYGGVRDLLVASLLKDGSTKIQGDKIDYASGSRTKFDYLIPQDGSFKGIGTLLPASYLIFDERSNALLPGSPMFSSGIRDGDRILWVNGEMVFSLSQLRSLLNEPSAFLTVRRDGKVMQAKVARVRLEDLKLTDVQRAEFDDWRYEAGLKGRLQDLYVIPYLLSPSCSVEATLSLQEGSSPFQMLRENDIVLSIDGQSVENSYTLLNHLQARHATIIVQRDPVMMRKVVWTEADEEFGRCSGFQELHELVSSIGTGRSASPGGRFVLLNPVMPRPLAEIPLSPERTAIQAAELGKIKREIESIRDPQKRAMALKEFEKSQPNAVLGILLKDREVTYNPSPWSQCSGVLTDIWRTVSHLFTGGLSPKYMSGPLGIVQIVHQSWMVGAKEALFWMGMISLNLGILNLLPMPVLDGGHICFSLFEAVTRRRLSGKVMERLMIPFVALLIIFFFFVTYQDILRLLMSGSR